MKGRCFTILGCVAGLLFAAATTLAADQPAQGSAVLQPVTTTMEVHAPNPVVTAEEYKRLQDASHEIVKINIVSVKTVPAQTDDHNPGALLVTARATVIGVAHSSTNLQAGTAIYLLYGYAPPMPGIPAPPPYPLIKANTEYLAFLTGGPGDNPYQPMAGAKSFVDPGLFDAYTNSGAASQTTGPIADPSALPSPDNPAPAGSVRVRDPALAQFVKLSQHNGKWFASVAESDPLPLQSIGDAKPVPLVYYMARLGEPLTQPTVLVYQAGVQPAPPPMTSEQTVVRALILDGSHHFLGDTLWELRVDPNLKTPPLPIWHWASYKLEVEDPVTHKMETILLTGNSAPAPVVSPPSPSPAK